MEKGPVHTWKYLLEQYLDNRISKEELAELLRKAGEEEDMEMLTIVLKEQWEASRDAADNSGKDWDAKFTAMMEEAPQIQERRPVSRIMKIAVAASIAALIAIGGYFFSFRKTAKLLAITSTNTRKDIAPGTTGGILVLSNGQQIALDSAGNGLLAVQGDTRVTSHQGKIVYNNAGRNSEQIFNTVVTPRSKQYQLVLADGSSVWLNAASSVRFPAAFSGDVRRVEITGEAYFEVAPLLRNGKKVPFIVSTRGMEVQVLGTHFNVNAYPDEHTIKTTLLEGSVMVSKGNAKQLLKPGEQARLDAGNNLVLYKDVDTEEEVAWKNGYFSFDHADLGSVMRQIARWYDVDIVYAGQVSDRRFGGEISRTSNVSEVLKILEESKVHFKIEEKRIIVLP
jgi:transmembrane sensor